MRDEAEKHAAALLRMDSCQSVGCISVSNQQGDRRRLLHRMEMTSGLLDWKGEAGNWVDPLESVERAEQRPWGMSWGTGSRN